MIWPNKWFAPKPKLTDADFLEVGDSSGAGGVGVVGDSGAGDGGAALAAAPLVAQQHGEAAGARVIALLQAVHRDTDVVPAVANINIIIYLTNVASTRLVVSSVTVPLL